MRGSGRPPRGVPLEVVGRRPCLTLVTVHDSHDVPHVAVAGLPIVAVIIVGRGCSPLRMLLVPSLSSLSALAGALDGDVRWCLPAATWSCLPASWWWHTGPKFSCLTAGGILGNDAAQLIRGVLENVMVFALARVLCAAFRSRTRVPPGKPITELGA
jgi:hypothetical protein